MAGLAGVGGDWGPAEEALHPRGPGGRWRRKAGIPAALKRALAKIQSGFREHTFHSNGQAGQWAWNHAKPGRFSGAERRRMLFDWDHANEALFQGETDPETEKFVQMMDNAMVDLPEDVIAHKVVPAEAFGFTPQQMGDGRGPGIADLLGGVVADPGYAMTGLGEPLNPNGGPGSVRMAIAVPKGTKVAFIGADRNDRNMALDRNQNLTITRIEPDGKGGFYMWAVATPPEGAEPGPGTALDTRRRGAGLTPQQRAEALAQPTPSTVSTPESRAGTPPPVGAGGQVTQAPTPTPDATNQPQPSVPTAGGPPPRNGEPIAAESIGGNGPEAGAPSTSDIAQRMDQPTPAPAPPAEPAVPVREVPATPHQEALGNVQKRLATKKAHREMRQAIPVAQAMQEIAQLDKQGASNEVKAQHIRGMITDPSMEEMAGPDREKLAQELEAVAQDFDRGKNNQARAKLASIGNRAGLTERDRAGETVDFNPDTMEPVGDATPTGPVEVIQPSIVHVDDNGRETVISKARVRSAGGAAPEAPATPEAPAAPVKAAKKAAGAKFTPDQERRLLDRAAQWRGQERNDEERRIVAEADKILARRGEQAAPGPVREPRAGRAPMAKKAAAPAAPAPAKKAAAPEKKAAPKKLTPERDPYTHTGANIIKDANEKLANGRDPEQVAEEMREDVDALLEHGEPLGTDDLVNPGRLGHDDEDLRDIARADSSLIHRMADDLEKESAPAPAVKKAPTPVPVAKKAAPEKKAPAKKAEPKKAIDLLAEQRARKEELARRQGQREQLGREKAAERARLAEEKKAAAAKAKEDRAATKAAAPAKAAKKAAPAKDLTPDQQAAAEVQARADEAGLPSSVAELRAQAKEQGIRGFSTMRKEQLQRALLGEEVSTGTTKLQVVSPEKMVGHLARVDSDSAARTLLDKHTLKDLQALADNLEIDRKERKLSTKDKLKNAILEQVRGTPGTDFQPISPDEAVSIRDVQVPDGPDGDMLRRGLGEVDDTDPASLRDESERLESHATQLRQRGDKVNADLYQEASDRMGMRAQQISGMEEVPKPTKRAPRKAAAPKKRTEAEVRALIGPKLTDELLQAAGDHERQRKDALRLMEGLAKANPDSGVGRAAKKAAADLRAPAAKGSIRDQAKDLGMTEADSHSLDHFQEKLDGTNTIFKGNDLGRPLTKREVADDIDDFIDNPFTGLKEQRNDASKAGDTDKAVELQERMDRMRALAQRLRGRAPVKKAAPVPERPKAEVARATERATKAVAPGSVPGPRAQAPVRNPERAQNFLDAMAEAGLPDRGARPAQVSIDEIARDISDGKYSPEEGIRRLETDIDLNKLDLAEMDAQLRGDLTVQDRASIRKQHGLLKEDIDAQEKASKFMRGHFRKEPEVTPAEAKAALDPEQQSWLDNASPDEIREGARQAGLGEVGGTTAEEVWNNAVKAVVDREMKNRETAKAKAAKKAAKKALPKVEPKLDPEAPDRLDVRQIGTGIEFKEEDTKMLEDVQRRLDAGESPASIGKDWGDASSPFGPRAQRAILTGVTDIDARIADAKAQKMEPREIERLEGRKADLELDRTRLQAQAERQEELARRLQAMKRPAKKAAAPAAGPETLEMSPEQRAAQIKQLRDHARVTRQLGDMRVGNNPPGSQHHQRGLKDLQDADRMEGEADSLERAGRPAKKAARIGPGGSSFPADMPAEERARRLAQIEKPQAATAPGASRELPPLANGTRRKSMANVEVGDLVRGASGSQGERSVPKRVTSVERDGRRMVITREDGLKFEGAPQTAVWLGEAGAPEAPVPEVQAAKKETAGVQARLLTTAMERLESARTEAQVRDAVKGLTMPELKTVAGKYPLENVGRSKESLTKALVDFHTNRANFEVLTRGGHRDNPIEPGRFSDKPKLPNTYETRTPSDVFYHDDGPVGVAVGRMGADAKLNVDGDSLENTVNRLATRSAKGQISAQQMLDDLKTLHGRLPEGPGKSALKSAIDKLDSPNTGPLPLPEGTPAPMVELMQMFSGMPLARIPRRRGELTLMQELQKIAQELAAGDRLRGGPDMVMMERLHNRFHESFEAEGKFELDRAVQRAAKLMEELRREQAKARRLAAGSGQ